MTRRTIDLVALEHRGAAAPERDGAVLDDLLGSDRLHCHFQPLVALASGDVVGYEALLRGTSPFPSPLELFDLAARLGRVVAVDRLARLLALRTADPLCADALLLLNCEPGSLTGHRAEVDMLLELVEAHGVVPERVVLELTEHRSPDDLQGLARAVRGYRERGVRIAVDDVGSGFSSLALVAALEPDVLKVDAGIGRALPHSVGARAVLRAVVGLATDLGALVVVEGIEDEASREAAAESGAAWGQGWLFGRPRAPWAGCCGASGAPDRSHAGSGASSG